jgi:hypothetical protein
MVIECAGTGATPQRDFLVVAIPHVVIVSLTWTIVLSRIEAAGHRHR